MITHNNKKHQLCDDGNLKYYSFPGLLDVQKEMLRLLKIINRIAKDNNLAYWIDGGSLIGVVRHHGFIPWDDDLDISLIKKDYLKLISLLKEYCQDNNDAILMYEEPYYHTCNYFASTTIYTRSYASSLLVPVKVDIRPVNAISSNSTSKDNNNRLRDIANLLLFNKSMGYVKKEEYEGINPKDFFEYYNNQYGIDISDEKEDLLVHPYFEYSNQFDLHLSDLVPTIILPFEDIEVPAPANYDYILRQLYGDYMELPSLASRAPVACSLYKMSHPKRALRKYLERLFYHNKNKYTSLFYSILYGVRFLGPLQLAKIRLFES